ncbi:unnamed protein product [Miscanthus lutarioriparius]|uniref:Uncharacterized protein n=1 Tax=Miscanthus lutarioriparius TaxID=422564 RepID=A0A811NHE1_9POAL|nr:unnamed protein product [Miscanthus lutarioriparius]
METKLNFGTTADSKQVANWNERGTMAHCGSAGTWSGSNLSGSEGSNNTSLCPTIYRDEPLLIQLQLTASCHIRHHVVCSVARHYHGAHPLQQAQGILHDIGITGQCDLAIAAREAELLLGHLQELREDCCPEARQGHLKPCPVSRVHCTVALACHGSAALVDFLCCCREALPPKRCHPLPLLGQLSDPLGADHGYFFLSWLETGDVESSELRL